MEGSGLRSYLEVPDLRQAIVVHFRGGLGNMLFQYFNGLAVSKRLDVPLYAIQEREYIHRSQLEPLGVRLDHISLPVSLLKRARRGRDRKLLEHFRSMFGLWLLNPVHEPHFHYWQGILKARPGSLLSGFWQSHRYFEDLPGKPLDYLDKEKMSEGIDSRLLQLAMRKDTAAVHIRRGDYLSNPSALARHGILERSYYDAARAELLKHADVSTFLVFSDEPERARQELGHWDNAIFVSGQNEIADLRLMGCCRHKIIANSTFSWWAATLEDDSDCVVIAPREWFAPQTLAKRNMKDLFPAHWELVSSV